MSYRVDIPTLSANEVYTLTFEYEGTETIQLVVGDLTLETTDRRVVFTTTSPVNHIESNVNLTNLNMYEGYYESDDFGGEYTQESYIEGRSLVNLCEIKFIGDTSSWKYQMTGYDEEGYMHIIPRPSGNATYYKVYPKVQPWKTKYGTYTLVIDFTSTLPNKTVDTCWESSSDAGKSQQKYKDFTYNGGQSRKFVVTFITSETQNYYMELNLGDLDLTTNTSGEVLVSYMVVEGDYFDEFCKEEKTKSWQGIGCVKSPKIVSYPKYPNIAPNCKRSLSNVTSTVYRSDDNSYIKITNTTRWTGVYFGFYPQDFGYAPYDTFCLEFDVLDYKGTGTISNGTAIIVAIDFGEYLNSMGGICYIDKIGHYKEYFRCIGSSETGKVCNISVFLNTGTGGINTLIEIDNLKVYKIDSVNDTNEYEDCIITTPDNLELYCNHFYDKNTKTSSPCHQDTLDLTTGTVTRKNIKARLNDSITKYGSVEGSLVTVNGGNMVCVKYNHINSSSGAFPVQVDGEVTGSSVTGIVLSASQGGYDGAWNPTSDIEHTYTNTNTLYMYLNPSRFDGIDYTNSATIKNWLIEQDFTLIIKIHNTSVYTEQLSTPLNPLKSYYNGSITTSSQQLTPTLKTTLPISNKFTTTNLTSGSTYNVYFDGTATKLDAGGTIITNPVSPCEVECGGTTLTIEGTDIQNVRVIETTVKNEVGSICGTTDVELKKIKTYKYENVLDDITYKTSVWNGAVININYDDFCIEFMGAHGWAGEFADTGLKYPTGCSLVHVEFDIDMDNPNLRMAINFNEGIYNNYPQHRHVTLNNDTATIAQGTYDNIYTSIVTKGHFSRLMYADGDRPIIVNLYTGSYITGNLATGNSAEGSIDGYEATGSNYGRITNLRMRIIENFSSNYTTVTSVLRDSSYNIIWQDMDMTIPQTISKLEQSIKLRSLGTTYDSYNPITGELTKRIGVSETDGSYSVLSSPIVIPPKYKMLQDNNIMPNSFPQQMNSGYVDFLPTQLLPNTTYTIFLDATTAFGQLECGLLYNADWYDGVKHFTVGVNRFIYTTGNDVSGYYSNTSHRGFRIRGQGSIINNLIMVEGEYSLDFYNPINVPHLYTNGQVKVYSESDVYPTTILNGQSTNNYEVNELNKSNNYTIRYDGECESINLANKSNEQGTNRIVKTSTNGSGNLTFVNDSGDIDNVLLVQNDVREQEINHFNGLQTVEVSGMLIETSQNMWWNDWIEPSQYDASWLVDSADYIQVNGGETIYIVANDNTYYSIVEFDENYTKINFSNTLIGNTQQRPVVKNGYYKNFLKLRDNTKYIKFVAPKGNAQNQTSNPTFTFSRVELNEPILSANIPYQLVIVDLPQPVQLNSLPDGTCDTYNPITGEYVQNVGTIQWDSSIINWNKTWSLTSSTGYSKLSHVEDWGEPSYKTLVNEYSMPNALTAQNSISNNATMSREFNGGWSYWGAVDFGVGKLAIIIPREFPGGINEALQYLDENPIIINYKRTTPIITQLTPIEIPTFESGILQLITTDGKVFPMIEYSMPTNNRYDTTSWEAGKVYTQRNMTEAYFNESTTPMTPTETMTLTTDHISSGSIILNDNGNGLIVLKGNYTGRDIPYFTGMRSVEAIEVETTPSPDQPLFGKGGRK